MTAEYKNTGKTIDIVPDAAVEAGEVIAWGGSVAIIAAAQEAGRPVAAYIEGEFEVPKATGVAMALGEPIGWDEVDAEAVALDDGDLYLGRVTEAAGSTAEYVKVKINAPGAVVPAEESGGGGGGGGGSE